MVTTRLSNPQLSLPNQPEGNGKGEGEGEGEGDMEPIVVGSESRDSLGAGRKARKPRRVMLLSV